jgi:hypothetical protein
LDHIRDPDAIVLITFLESDRTSATCRRSF